MLSQKIESNSPLKDFNVPAVKQENDQSEATMATITEEAHLKRFKERMEMITFVTNGIVEQFEGITEDLNAIHQHSETCRARKEEITVMADDLKTKLDALMA